MSYILREKLNRGQVFCRRQHIRLLAFELPTGLDIPNPAYRTDPLQDALCYHYRVRFDSTKTGDS